MQHVKPDPDATDERDQSMSRLRRTLRFLSTAGGSELLKPNREHAPL